MWIVQEKEQDMLADDKYRVKQTVTQVKLWVSIYGELWCHWLSKKKNV